MGFSDLLKEKGKQPKSQEEIEKERKIKELEELGKQKELEKKEKGEKEKTTDKQKPAISTNEFSKSDSIKSSTTSDKSKKPKEKSKKHKIKILTDDILWEVMINTKTNKTGEKSLKKWLSRNKRIDSASLNYIIKVIRKCIKDDYI